MPKQRRNVRRRNNQIPIGNGGGPTRTPKVTMLKRLQYVDKIGLTNATNTYAYYSDYIHPQISKCVGALNQFAAYELWRIKRYKVSIQLAGNESEPASQSLINDVANSTIWTAADLAANESVSGQQLMQYQNAKRNTLSLNKWTKIVDTACNINCSLQTDEGKSATTAFILPRSTWINTNQGLDSKFYSGFQIFIQNFANRTAAVDRVPVYQLQHEIHVEFMQPGYQSLPTSFSHRFLNHNIRVIFNDGDTSFTELTPKSITHSNQGTILTYQHAGVDYPFTAEQIRNIIAHNQADNRFGNRRAQYDGIAPPATESVQTPPHTLIGTTFYVPSTGRNYIIVAAGTTTVDAEWGNGNIDVVNMSDIAGRIENGTYQDWNGPDVFGW